MSFSVAQGCLLLLACLCSNSWHLSMFNFELTTHKQTKFLTSVWFSCSIDLSNSSWLFHDSEIFYALLIFPPDFRIFWLTVNILSMPRVCDTLICDMRSLREDEKLWNNFQLWQVERKSFDNRKIFHLLCWANLCFNLFSSLSACSRHQQEALISFMLFWCASSVVEKNNK